MNKKFSTLMAGLMLASAFSVNAADVVKKYEANKGYRLQTSTTGEVMAVVSNPENDNYGQLVLIQETALTDINAVKAATWNIVFTQPTDGTAPKFTYINKATGLTLSVDPEANGDLAFIKGSVTEWLNTSVLDNGSTPFSATDLRSFYKANEVVYLIPSGNTVNNDLTAFNENNETAISYKTLNVKVEKNVTSASAGLIGAIEIAPAKANAFNLKADDLNSQLGKLNLNVVSDDQAWFNLYFNKDVTSDAETNLFAATQLKAVQLYEEGGKTVENKANSATPTIDNPKADYVKLLAKDMDGAYITVDTAYHAGSESIGYLPKFTYAKRNYEGTNNVMRLPESSHFAFAYDSYNDRVLIKVEDYYTKKTGADYNKAAKVKGADGNPAYTYWGFNGNGSSLTTSATLIESDAYVRLATLASVRELTVAEKGITGDNYTTPKWTIDGTDWSMYGMLTNVSLSQNDQTFAPTTVAEGLYLIKLHTSGYDKDGNKRTEADGDYLIASLAGNFGYAEQAKNQNYDHMPAAQWYVKQNGTSATAPISIQNREFFDKYENLVDVYFASEGASIQAFNAGDGRVFFTNGVFANDTLEFIPVSAESKKNSKLGYKYVDEKQASVETYYFNYLHGLTLDKGLNTPSDKDSLVRVDETGDKIALRLIPVTKDDSYGIQLDEKKTGIANLVRNAYYIEAYDNLKFAADGRSRYLSYEPSSKKYVMSLVPEMFFLKENNCIDGTPYYALVNVNAYGKLYKSTNWATGLSSLIKKMYPAAYKGKSTVFDATEIWSYDELVNNWPKKTVIVNNEPVEVNNPLTKGQVDNVQVIFYDKNGEPIIADGSEAVELYAYMPNSNNEITLQPVKAEVSGAMVYYAMNPDAELFQKDITNSSISSYSTLYAYARISVDDNTLDLFIAELGNNNTDWAAELRVSTFEAQVNDSPLYRRFNGANGEYGTEANAPLNLKFFRHNNNAEYLFENYASENEYRDGINDKEISFLGVNNAFQFAESETRSYTMFVDTAYVRANTRMPQYLIGIRPEVVEGDTTLCDASTHQHATPEEALACEHSKINVGFTRAMYLFNAQDSVDVKNYDYQGKAAYGAQGYTRLAFKDAVHPGCYN